MKPFPTLYIITSSIISTKASALHSCKTGPQHLFDIVITPLGRPAVFVAFDLIPYTPFHSFRLQPHTIPPTCLYQTDSVLHAVRFHCICFFRSLYVPATTSGNSLPHYYFSSLAYLLTYLHYDTCKVKALLCTN